MVELAHVPQVVEVHSGDATLHRVSRRASSRSVVAVKVRTPRREEHLEDGVDVAVVVIVCHDVRQVDEHEALLLLLLLLGPTN